VLKAGLFVVLMVALQMGLMKIGAGLRCPFRLLTGLKCPGCGVSHMARDLLRGNVTAAFYDNPVVFTELPFLLYVIGRKTYRYVRYDRSGITRGEEVILIAAFAALLVFGVLRNLPALR